MDSSDQHIIEDNSGRYFIDWHSFSFENELAARKNILQEQGQAFKSFVESVSISGNDSQVNANDSIANELPEVLRSNENIMSRYDSLIADCKTIKANVKSLMTKNETFEQSISELNEQETKVLNEYHLMKKALLKAVKVYTTCFDIDVKVNTLSDTTYEAHLKIGNEKGRTPIKFIVDREKKVLLGSNATEILAVTEEEIRKQFGDLNNIPGLLCALREVILNK